MNSELSQLRIEKHHKASRHQRPIWPWAVGVLLLATLGAGAWWWNAAGGGTPVETVRVRVPDATASSAPSDVIALDASGYIVAAHKVELASKVIGRVAWVGVEMGDRIKAGQPLVRLEDDEYRARVTQAEGQLEAAKAKLAELIAGSRPQEVAQAQAFLDQALANLAGANRDAARVRELRSTASRKELDDAETLVQLRTAQVEGARQQLELLKAGTRQEQIDAQRATVRQLEGGLKLAQVDLANTVISAPNDATVLSRNVEVGEFVTTGFVGDRGAKGYVVSIADLNDLRVDLDVSQDNFSKVAPEQPCLIVTDAYPDRKYEGVVDLISPEANRQKATVQVRVKVLRPDSLLRPDMNAKVSFLARVTGASTQGSAPSERPLVRIPAGCVRDGAVFVIDAGRAVRTPVTLGRSVAGGDVEVKQGLLGGEDVVVDPPAGLKGGDRVVAATTK